MMRDALAISILTALFASLSASPHVVLGEEALDAAQAVGAELRLRGHRPTLAGVCVADGAELPSYRVTFYGNRSVCVMRPWRVMGWHFDLDDAPRCGCAS